MHAVMISFWLGNGTHDGLEETWLRFFFIFFLFVSSSSGIFVPLCVCCHGLIIRCIIKDSIFFIIWTSRFPASVLFTHHLLNLEWDGSQVYMYLLLTKRPSCSCCTLRFDKPSPRVACMCIRMLLSVCYSLVIERGEASFPFYKGVLFYIWLLVYKRFRDLHLVLSCLLIFKSSSSSIFGSIQSID